MKRIVLSLAACALTLSLAAAVRADEPAGSSASTPQKSTEAAPSTGQATAPAQHHVVHRKAAMTRVDLNSASKEELMKLPGVTDAVADKIIGARPFKSSLELKTKSLVTKAEWAKLASRVTAKKAS